MVCPETALSGSGHAPLGLMEASGDRKAMLGEDSVADCALAASCCTSRASFRDSACERGLVFTGSTEGSAVVADRGRGGQFAKGVTSTLACDYVVP